MDLIKVIPYNEEYDIALRYPLSSIHRAADTIGLPTRGEYIPHVERKPSMTKFIERMAMQSKNLLLC